MSKRLKGEKMSLLQRAQKVARQNGKTIDRQVATGLKAIQAMHDLAQKVKGSAYEIYMSEKKQKQ